MNLTDNRIQQIIDETGGHFNVDDFGKHRHNLNADAVRSLCEFRKWHKFPTYLSSVWRKSGSHSVGAFDQFLFDDYSITQPEPMHLWRLATTWNWWGVGIYFDTHAFGEPAIMLHTDVLGWKRSQSMDSDRPLRWIRTDGEYYYQSLKDGRFYGNGKSTELQAEIERWKRKNINEN